MTWPRCIVFFLLLILGTSARASLPDSILTAIADLPDSGKVQYLIVRAQENLYSQPALSREFCEKAQYIATQNGAQVLQAKVANQRGTVSWAEGKYAAALTDYKLAKRLYEEIGDSLGLAKANNNIGLVYTDISAYDLALKSLLASLGYFERRNDLTRLATIYNNIGMVYARNEDLENASRYDLRALEAFTAVGDTGGMAMASNNLGLVYRDQKKNTLAQERFEEALAGYIQLHHLYGEAAVRNNLGSILRDQGDFAGAEEMQLRSLEIGHVLNNANILQVAELKLSELYNQSAKPAAALSHAQASLQVGAQTGAKLELATAHAAMAEAFQSLGRFDSALVHFKIYKALNDEMFNAAKSKTITELGIRYETDLKDAEISGLQKQQKFDALLRIGLIALLIALLVIGVLVVMRQRVVVQREKLQLELAQQAQVAERALALERMATLESERLRLAEELAHKQKEIGQLATNIAKRHDFLVAMDLELKTLRKEMDEQKLKALSQTVSQTLSLENERQEFLIYIQDAQSNFFMKLNDEFPGLSEKERRLCAMVKLGLSNKEIGAVLNIETASVEVARYRLRKKLNLDTNENLKTFLDEF